MDQKSMKLKFFITFESMTTKNCPSNLKGKECYLRYKRGANDLKTKKVAINQNGFAELADKIEMTTFVEFDNTTGKYI